MRERSSPRPAMSSASIAASITSPSDSAGGLGIATGTPQYVTKIEPASQRVVVGPKADLLRKTFRAGGLNWISIPSLMEPLRVEIKIRHQFKPAPGEVRPASAPTRVEVEFDTPQPAVTPGQAAVFYQGDLVVGGGWIE